MRVFLAFLVLVAGAAGVPAQGPKPKITGKFDGEFGIALVNKDFKNTKPNEPATTIAVRYYSKDDKPSTITDVQLTIHYVFDVVGTDSKTGEETRKPKVVPKWQNNDLITVPIPPAYVEWTWFTVEGTSGGEKFKFEMPRPRPPTGKPADFPGAIRYDIAALPSVANPKNPYTIRLWYELDAGAKGPVGMVEGEVTIQMVRGLPKLLPFRIKDWQPGRTNGRDFSFREQPHLQAPILMDGKAALDGKPVRLHFRLTLDELFPPRIPEGTQLIPLDFRATVSEAGGDADKKYPLPQNPDASEERQKARKRKWLEGLKAAFDKGPAGKADSAAKMRRAIEAFARVQVYRAQEATNPVLRTFMMDLATAAAAGVDDPLMRYWQMRYLNNTGRRSKYTSPQGIDIDPESYVELLKACSASSYPALMKMYMAHSLVVKFYDSKLYKPKKAPPEYDRALAEGTKAADAFFWEQVAALAKTEGPEELDALVDVLKTRFIMLKKPDEEVATELLTLLAAAKAPKWLQLFIEGEYMSHLSNLARNSNDPNSDQLFRQRIEAAREKLEASAKLEPNQSYAFGGMISVCTSLGLEREEMERWFKRAMEINSDEWNACNRKLFYLHPNRHGTLDDYFDFLDQCIRTRNWRSGIPQLADDKLVDLYDSMPQRFGNNIGHPAIFCRIKAAFELILQEDIRNSEAISTFALICMVGEHWKEAYDSLLKLDEGELRSGPLGLPMDLAAHRAYCRNKLPVKK